MTGAHAEHGFVPMLGYLIQARAVPVLAIFTKARNTGQDFRFFAVGKFVPIHRPIIARGRHFLVWAGPPGLKSIA
jgi:hypothetical protein